jgi:hypothetical protein
MKDSWGVKDVELPENIYKLTGLKICFHPYKTKLYGTYMDQLRD